MGFIGKHSHTNLQKTIKRLSMYKNQPSTKINIGYQGIPGSFTYIASQNFFKKTRNYGFDLQFTGFTKFRQVFEGLKLESLDLAVIPVENSLAGSVLENYDLLNRYPVKVVGEQYLKINHHLLVAKNSKANLSSLNKVFSHPKALAQCQDFFWQQKHIQEVNFSDTAGAAKYIATQNNPKLGAIASLEAAKLYNLKILQFNIEDNSKNYTRFFVITNSDSKINLQFLNQNLSKASLIFELIHQPGNLAKILQAFACQNLNLTKIESRPILGKPFEYSFNVDFTFPKENSFLIEQCLQNIKKHTTKLNLLGIYQGYSLSSEEE